MVLTIKDLYSLESQQDHFPHKFQLREGPITCAAPVEVSGVVKSRVFSTVAPQEWNSLSCELQTALSEAKNLALISTV